MRVVFLDFDGVYAEVERKYGLGPKNLANWSNFTEAEWLDPALVRAVGALVLECEAIVAISSSWRQRHGLIALRRILRSRGLPRGVAVARCAPFCSKEEVVTRFLQLAVDQGCPVSSYVVLDDNQLDLPDPDRLVRTDGSVGLTTGDVAEARRVLLGGHAR